MIYEKGCELIGRRSWGFSEAIIAANNTAGGDTTGISIKPISVENTERIVRFAFDYARANGRSKVTWVHKANIMKFTDGLFKEVAEQVARDYTDIEGEERLVDNMCMQLVQKPELYDVIVLPNLYGDILSDLCAGLVGGLGVAPGATICENGAVVAAPPRRPNRRRHQRNGRCHHRCAIEAGSPAKL